MLVIRIVRLPDPIEPERTLNIISNGRIQGIHGVPPTLDIILEVVRNGEGTARFHSGKRQVEFPRCILKYEILILGLPVRMRVET